MAKVGLVLALCFAAAIALPLQQGGDDSISLLSEGGATTPELSIPKLDKEITDRKAEGETLTGKITAETTSREADKAAAAAAAKSNTDALAVEKKAREDGQAKTTADMAAISAGEKATASKQKSQNAALTAAMLKADSAIKAEVTNREGQIKTTEAAMTAVKNGLNQKIADAESRINQATTVATDAMTKVSTSLKGQVAANTKAIQDEKEARSAATDRNAASNAATQAQITELFTAIKNIQSGKNVDIAALTQAMAKAKADATAPKAKAAAEPTAATGSATTTAASSGSAATELE